MLVERAVEEGVRRAIVDDHRVRHAGLAQLAVEALELLNRREVGPGHQQQQWRGLQDAVQSIPEVVYVALVGGEFDAVVLVRARDNENLREVVLEGIQAIPGVTGTRTYLIFDELDRGR